MRRLPAVAAVLIAIAAAGCGREAEGGPPAAGGRGAGGPGPAAAGGRSSVPVEIVAAREQRVEDAITGTGQIEAVQAIEVRPEAEGRIVEIHFREGARVAAGAPLTKVDDAELRAQVNRVTAERDLANQTLQRARQLTEQQASSPEELERAEATARATQAQLDLLQLRLERTVVRAPFAGVLGARLVSLGDYVTPQTRIVSLQTVSPQRAVLNVPERYAERLRVGQRVRFTVGALPGREFTGVVDFVDPVVRLPGRTILIKAGVPNPRGDLQPGMFIEGRLVAAVRERAVVIPEDAVLPLQGEFLVWVVTNDRAERRTVDLGVRTPGFVEVLRGVAAGEDVVVGGAERLSEGASVRATRVERAGGS